MVVFTQGILNLAAGMRIRIHFDQFPNGVEAGLPWGTSRS